MLQGYPLPEVTFRSGGVAFRAKQLIMLKAAQVRQEKHINSRTRRPLAETPRASYAHWRMKVAPKLVQDGTVTEPLFGILLSWVGNSFFAHETLRRSPIAGRWRVIPSGSKSAGVSSPNTQSQCHPRAPQSQCHLRALSQVVKRIAQQFHLLRALTIQILKVWVGEEALDNY